MDSNSAANEELITEDHTETLDDKSEGKESIGDKAIEEIVEDKSDTAVEAQTDEAETAKNIVEMSTVENVSSTVDCQNSVQPETCDITKDDMEQCHSIEKSTDNIETEDRETDVGSSTADAKTSDNSAERAEVVEEECHQKVIHELTKDSEVIQKEETQTIDVDDVSQCSHGSICEPAKQKDDIFDTDTKDIENATDTCDGTNLARETMHIRSTLNSVPNRMCPHTKHAPI